MQDIIESYRRDIDRMLARVNELDAQISSMPNSTERVQIVGRRMGLLSIIRETQKDVVDMLNRARIE